MTLGDWLILALLLLNLLVLIVLALRRPPDPAATLGPLLNLPVRVDDMARQQRDDAERLGRELRQDVATSASTTRAELGQVLSQFQQALTTQSGDVARTQNEQIDGFRVQLATTQQQLSQSLAALQQQVAQALQGTSQTLTDGLQRSAEAQHAAQAASREAQDMALKRFADSQREQLAALTEANERRLAEVRQAVEQRLAALQDGNEKKLEQMRATVDEKLHATLEQRLGESFKQVADRLDQVHQGLGDMRNLARDVGSLNRVLTNVKTRGVFGEVQLGALLDQVLAPDQYAANVETVPGTGARVEFAVRYPGQREGGAPLWLPIDAKFPREDYERLLAAHDAADMAAAEAAAKGIETRLKLEAKTIREKYIATPHTTDFGILFLPTEGLYAEALRRPGLVESLQRDHRVVLAGPTTLLAMLSTVQMGFRSQALAKRSAEVWEVLGAVKVEFGKFGDVLEKTQKKLQEASNTIDQARTRTNVMARKLKTVETLTDDRAQLLLGNLADDLTEDGA